MVTPLVEIRLSADEVSPRLRSAIDFVTAGEVGRVYSEGASQEGRRYDHYVQSAVHQAWMHEGRWQTDEMAIERFTPVAQGIAEQAAEAIFETGDTGDARALVEDLLQQVKEYMQEYPPAPAGSRYVRTNTLHKSWRAQSVLL